MGSDKALLSWAGVPLIQRTLSVARQACGQVFICGPRERYGRFGEVVEDAESGRGPLSGIQAALHATQTDRNLVLSVDLPLMTAEFLAWLVEEARVGKQEITAPDVGGNLQPLCAVYRRNVVDIVDEALAKGELKVTRLFQRTPTRIIGEHEVRAAGFEPSIFTNVNTPEEYESLLQTVPARESIEPRHE